MQRRKLKLKAKFESGSSSCCSLKRRLQTPSAVSTRGLILSSVPPYPGAVRHKPGLEGRLARLRVLHVREPFAPCYRRPEPSRYCSPRHGMSFNSTIEGSKRVGQLDDVAGDETIMYDSPRHRMPFKPTKRLFTVRVDNTAGNEPGAYCSLVMSCHSSQRFEMRVDDVANNVSPGRCCSPRHRMPFNS